MQGLQQRGGEAAGGSEPGPGRNVGQRRDLDLGRLELLHAQCLANDRMLDLVDRLDVLERGIFEIDPGLNGRDDVT